MPDKARIVQNPSNFQDNPIRFKVSKHRFVDPELEGDRDQVKLSSRP